MATKLFLKDAAPSTLSLGSGTRACDITAGAAQTNSDATATVTGPTGPLVVKKGGAQLLWTSPPVNAFTMAGAVTLNIWGIESNLAANAGFGVAIDIFDQAGNFVDEPFGLPQGAKGTELPTTVAAQNWSVTPSVSHNVPQGAIIVVSLFFDDVGTMASGNTVTASYNGGTGGSNGDSFVSFTETITFVSGAAPVNTALPTIAGTPAVGNTLTGSDGTWTGATSTSGVWRRDGGATPVGSGSSYPVVAADAGHTLTYEVTATNASGSTVATSAGVAVPASFALSAAPTLAGTARVGATLTITPGTYTITPTTVTYQWLRSTDNGATYQVIAGQTGLTYVLTAADMPNGTTFVKARETASR
jgi:hypothetical protein